MVKKIENHWKNILWNDGKKRVCKQCISLGTLNRIQNLNKYRNQMC